MEEIWKRVEHFDNYEISNYGRLKNVTNKRILRGCVRIGYIIYTLCKNRKKKNISGHKLVAKHFIPNPENRKEVNHLGNKDDNRVWMLEWSTRRENNQHAAKFITKFSCKSVNKVDPVTREIVETFDKKI